MCRASASVSAGVASIGLMALLLVGAAGSALGQSVSQLKNKRERLEREVELTAKLLKETQEVKSQSFSQLRLLERKIDLQQKILRTLEEEVVEMDQRIGHLGGLMTALDSDVVRLQRTYAMAIRTAYRHRRSHSPMLWLLGSENFAQAFNRLKYFRAFSSFRKAQIGLLRRAQKSLSRSRQDYVARKAEKQQLMARQAETKTKLDATKTQKNKLFKELKRKESRYKSQLKQARQSLEQLKREITEAIRREESRTRSKAEMDKIFKLSSSFFKNKSRLPWPIPMPSALITGYFGKQQDESGGVVYNEGLYFSTSRGQTARAVFEGEVTLVSRIPSFGSVVIVQHGQYRSVYANLDNVFVNKGQRVETLQNLGTIRTEGKTGETQLYFQLFQGYEPLNPLLWIAPK